jgi:preprotein translocase subunit SecE
MAEAQTTTKATAKDTLLVYVSIAAVLGGIVAFYWLDDRSMLLRVAAVIAGIAASIGLAALTWHGRQFWQFALGSRVELRKVVWPERDETMKTTYVVFGFAIALGVFFWGLDWVLTLLTRLFTGQAT